MINDAKVKLERTLLPIAKRLGYFDPSNLILNETATKKRSVAPFIIKLCADGTNIGFYSYF